MRLQADDAGPAAVLAQPDGLPGAHSLDQIRGRLDDDLAAHAMRANDAPGDHILPGLPGAGFRC